MEQREIQELLYEKYIVPTKKKRKGYIGVEIEMPILNLKKAAVDFDVVHQITAVFMMEFHFKAVGKDEDGHVYAAQDPVTGDILSYDCSYNNLELSMGKEKEIFAIQKRFETYYLFLQREFEKYNYMLTGMGVNPYRIYNHKEPIHNGRYRMLLHHLNSYVTYDIPKYFHPYPEYGLFSSASQVQLDVDYEDLIMTIRAFSRLEPIKAVLFSNSVLLGEREELPSFVDVEALYELTKKIVNLAGEGLVKRGFGEEILLEPLYERVEKRTNPAQYLLKNKNHLERVIEEYGSLSTN